MTQIGYTIIEWNQAGGTADIPSGAWLEPDRSGAEFMQKRWTDESRMMGRNDRYEIVTVHREDEV